MAKSNKSKAEQLFTATLRKDEQILRDRDLAIQERADKGAKLKVHRLAKEADDKKTSEMNAAK